MLDDLVIRYKHRVCDKETDQPLSSLRTLFNLCNQFIQDMFHVGGGDFSLKS